MKIGVILAGGRSSRFKSEIPKGMHLIDGVRLIDRIIECFNKCDIYKIYLVVNNDNFIYYKDIKGVEFLFQGDVSGTGGAFYSFNGLFNEDDCIVVTNSDSFMFDKNIIKDFYEEYLSSGFECGLISEIVDNPFGQGRIYEHDNYIEIIEEKECDENIKNIKEVNVGIYAFKGHFLSLKMKSLNEGKESKITTLYKDVRCFKYLSRTKIMSVNNKEDYHNLYKSFYLDNCYKWIEKGVKIYDVNNTYIGENVVIGSDVEIYPNSYILGNSVIGDHSKVYPNCFINNSKIGYGCEIGPFSNLKGINEIGDSCVVGAFVEIKDSVLKKNVKAKHHIYLGNCFVDENSNIGCGVISANYDGKNKHQTVIGKNSFIGSNVTFVAPVDIGDGVVIAAGSTITENVMNNCLAIARERQTTKLRKM